MFMFISPSICCRLHQLNLFMPRRVYKKSKQLTVTRYKIIASRRLKVVGHNLLVSVNLKAFQDIRIPLIQVLIV